MCCVAQGMSVSVMMYRNMSEANFAGMLHP